MQVAKKDSLPMKIYLLKQVDKPSSDAAISYPKCFTTFSPKREKKNILIAEKQTRGEFHEKYLKM